MATTKTELLINGNVVDEKTSAPFLPFNYDTTGLDGDIAVAVREYIDGELAGTTPVVNGTVTADSGGGGFDPDFQATLDAATSNGDALPTQAEQEDINQWLIDYKATGRYAKADVVAKFDGTAPEDFRLYCFKRKVKMTPVDTLAWDDNLGVTGVINLNYTPDGSGNYKLNDAGVYVSVTEKGPLGTFYIIGARGSSSNDVILNIYSNGPIVAINSDAFAYDSSLHVDGSTLFGISREDADDLIIQRQGESPLTIPAPSTSLPTIPMYLNGENTGSGTSKLFDGYVKFLDIGAKMSDVEFNAVAALM